MATGVTIPVRLPLPPWRRFLAVAGPGLVVMLADTDAGSVITAAQSGAQWGYKLLLFQFILMPLLYVVQELTVRLGIVTGQGHAVLIRTHFGRGWAWVSVATLMIACVGALLTEVAGIGGIGELLRVPMWATTSLVILTLVTMVVTGSYRSVERIALLVGGFELAFLAVAILSHPSLEAVARDSINIPIADPKYLLLVSANIGAVIMPWMVFYQQSSVIEKGLRVEDLGAARADTAVGSVVTQMIMAAVLAAAAAALVGGPARSLDTVPEIADALTSVLGTVAGRLCFGLGVTGAAMVAAIVVTLTAARTLGELIGYKHDLSNPIGEAPWFYAVYTLVLLAGAAILLSGPNLVTLSVDVQVMNAMLLPIVLTFLFLLARRLPPPFQLVGWRCWATAATMGLTVLLGLYSGIAGLFL